MASVGMRKPGKRRQRQQRRAVNATDAEHSLVQMQKQFSQKLWLGSLEETVEFSQMLAGISCCREVVCIKNTATVCIKNTFLHLQSTTAREPVRSKSVPVSSRLCGQGTVHGLTVIIHLVSGLETKMTGLERKMTLSALHKQVDDVLELPRLTARLCHGETLLADDSMELSLSALGIRDGASLTCIAGQPRQIPCPASGWEYIDPEGTIHGPFSLLEMQRWSLYGYFYPDLQMRFDNSFAFVPLSELFPEPLLQFQGKVQPPRMSFSKLFRESLLQIQGNASERANSR